MFVHLMESLSCFVWPKDVIASVKILMTEMIDFLMSLAANSVIFQFY